MVAVSSSRERAWGHHRKSGSYTPFLFPLLYAAGIPQSFNLGSNAQKELAGTFSITCTHFCFNLLGEHKTQIQNTTVCPSPQNKTSNQKLCVNVYTWLWILASLGLPCLSPEAENHKEHGTNLSSDGTGVYWGGRPAAPGSAAKISTSQVLICLEKLCWLS